MRGAINYLKAIKEICRENLGDCKKCPLGKEPKLENNICPRLTHPNTWSNERIVEMVKGVDK